MGKPNDLDAAYAAVPAPAAAPAFAPSKYQQDIFGWIDTGTGHAVVEAVAGSGKTTTILAALARMRGRVLFCAFNKHIADELARRAPRHAKVSTIHSLGFAALRKAHRHLEIDDRKMRRIIEDVVGDDTRETAVLRRAIEQLCRLAKLTLTDGGDAGGLADLTDHYAIECNGDYERVLATVPLALQAGLEEQGTIDFDDMIWLPHVLNLNPDRYDWVCVDEAQDLNAAQRALVLRACAGRLIAVGDRRQAIYGFAGADIKSIPTLTATLQATVLPLSICYRCPASHVALAKQIVPQIEARPGAPAGVVGDLGADELVRRLVAAPAAEGMEDLVICRINKPLAEIAMGLIRRGKKAVVRGRDIGTGLVNLIEKMKENDITDLLCKLDAYKAREVERLVRRKKDSQAAGLADRVETIQVLAEGEDSVAGLRRRIETIFSDDAGAGVVCSSIHKAKGLEAKRVYLHLPHLLPHPKAKEAWELVQEENLRYVALTRAKEELYMVAAEAQP